MYNTDFRNYWNCSRAMPAAAQTPPGRGPPAGWWPHCRTNIADAFGPTYVGNGFLLIN
jgi:hypothetical protein